MRAVYINHKSKSQVVSCNSHWLAFVKANCRAAALDQATSVPHALRTRHEGDEADLKQLHPLHLCALNSRRSPRGR